MSIFEFLKFIPKSAIFLLPLVLAFLTFATFSLFRKQKEEPQPAVSSLASTEAPPPPPGKGTPNNLLLILTALLLLLSLPMAVFLVKQGKEIRMRAEKPEELTPTPTSPPEELTPTPTPDQCDNIKVYQADADWTPIAREDLANLTPGETIRITVKGDPDTFDNGRIRINSMEWMPENETTEQKPDSPGEFYIECEVGVAGGKATICGISVTLENEFKIEAEVHDAIKNEWR